MLVFPTAAFAGQFKVVRVTDGDTIKAAIGITEIIVQLLGIDASEKSKEKHEPGQPFSQKAIKFLAGLILNKTITLKEFGTGRYGWTLGLIFADGANLNLEMVKGGLTEV